MKHDVTIEQAIQTTGQQLLLLPRPPGERVGQGGQVLQRGVRVCPGEWDRVGRCYSEESEYLQVIGTGWAGATARSQSLSR